MKCEVQDTVAVACTVAYPWLTEMSLRSKGGQVAFGIWGGEDGCFGGPAGLLHGE